VALVSYSSIAAARCRSRGFPTAATTTRTT
jgi:hypothetical protein